jgi:type IV pilus assembly protein PilA
MIELLLVIGIISILASVVFVAINPGKQLGDARNAQRRQDVNTLISAIYQYAIDNKGNLPPGIETATSCYQAATQEICGATTATSTNCVGLTNLSDLHFNQKYLAGMPVDPSIAATNTNGSRYFVVKSANGRVTVCAPNAGQEQSAAVISVTR